MAALSAGAAVVLALVVILGTSPGAGPVLGRALGFATPTPTATLATGADTIFFANRVPWGALTVDGQTPALALPGFNDLQWVKLARGAHTVIYSAAPFPTMHCKVSVPAAPNDTCRLTTDSALRVSFAPGAFRTVDLQATPDNLSGDQYMALAQAIQSALVTPDGTVQPGDHYLADTSKTMVASAPLTAHLVAGLPKRGEVNDNINGVTCDPLCPNPDLNPPAANAWHLGAMMTFAWRFTASSGQLISFSPTPDTSSTFIALDANWSSAWSVTLSYPEEVQQDLCVSAEAQLGQAITGITSQTTGVTYFSQLGTDGNPADGCLTRINTTLPSSAGGGSSDPQYTILSRFGALVAADTATQHALPQLPLASANERAIIASLSSSVGS